MYHGTHLCVLVNVGQSVNWTARCEKVSPPAEWWQNSGVWLRCVRQKINCRWKLRINHHCQQPREKYWRTQYLKHVRRFLPIPNMVDVNCDYFTRNPNCLLILPDKTVSKLNTPSTCLYDLTNCLEADDNVEQATPCGMTVSRGPHWRYVRTVELYFWSSASVAQSSLILISQILKQ